MAGNILFWLPLLLLALFYFQSNIGIASAAANPVMKTSKVFDNSEPMADPTSTRKIPTDLRVLYCTS